ncbi:hypothetical protein L082_25400 [Escherichia coli SHECO001]|uniref:type IV toxin-antitoxin system AbiEi family antitoxin domain-containing protein n=1 Tax=Escherichia coli TaxID=562 RepID=UPI000A184214|nr:hypothetical protein [Escherichia coli]OSJ99430.1 hypothetical protein L082_25400 [Escherichia coli SHECO001]
MYLIEEALTSWLLNEYKKPVITKEEISLQIYLFYLKKEYNGERIYQIRKNKAGPNEFEKNILKLLKSGVLSRVESNDKHHAYPHLIGGFYEVFFVKGNDGSPENDIVCSTYPYGYLSYLSAMDWHNITDKIPKIIHFTTCRSEQWKNKFYHDFQKDNPDIDEAKQFMPRFPRNSEVNGIKIIVTQETNYVEPMKARNSPVRVSSIGKTFMDMTRRPDYCGGEEHVLESFIEHGKKYAPLIIKEVDKLGRHIDKVRVGFILDRIIGVNNKKISEWKQEAGKYRGSSKVLSPKSPFSPYFDEEWVISINVDMVFFL